jgi:uncharacterized protein
MSDTINYGHLMHQAMRGLLAQVLRDVGKNGLPGKHHFFITFETGYTGVDLPDWLVERYPDEMTIVIQEWFANLTVQEDSFSITLNFGDDEVPMSIPFDAIRTFVDPSVEFGLRFEASEGEEAGAETGSVSESPMAVDVVAEPQEAGDAEVVSLDSFRK